MWRRSKVIRAAVSRDETASKILHPTRVDTDDILCSLAELRLRQNTTLPLLLFANTERKQTWFSTCPALGLSQLL